MDDSTRPSLPEPDSVSSVPESVATGGDEEAAAEKTLEHLPPEHREALRRLHRRVEQTAETIERLRAENERLRRRVEELEAQPSFPDDETVLTLDEDPEDVKQRITRFIDAIDTYLGVSADEDESGDASADAADAPSDP